MIKTIFQKQKTNAGYSLIEIIFYISIFVILSLVVINALIVMMKAFNENNIQADIVTSSSIMERISREIKQASSISSISTNDLIVMAPNELDVVRLVRFLLSNGNVVLYDNSILIDNLNSNDVTVSDLTFTQITTANGIAVKITLAVTSNRDQLGRVYSFYNTIVLRGDY